MPHEKGSKKTRASAGACRSHARAPQAGARVGRRPKIGPRSRTRGHTARAVGVIRGARPLVRLLEALEKEKIRYILIGMSGAVVQGVMTTTLDVDLWIDLPARQYMRVLRLAQGVGAEVAANTVVYMEDGTPVNFVYEVTGLGSFSREARTVKRVQIDGHTVPVLPLERILQSKQAIDRDKDRLHILQIREFLGCQREARRRRKMPHRRR